MIKQKGFLDAMRKIMSPAMPAILTFGILMGLEAILVQLKVLQQPPALSTKETIENLPVFDAIFWGISEVGLKFLAIFIGYSTMNYLGGNLIMSVLLGLTIANPLLFHYSWHLFYIGNLDIKVQSYPSTILPLMIANLGYFYLNEELTKIIPRKLGTINLLICYLIIVLTIYFIVGPILYLIEWGLALGTKYLEKIPFGIGTMLLSIIWEPLVMTGAHIPVGTVITMGIRGVIGPASPSILVPAFMYGSYGQLGAMLAVIIKTKDQKIKQFGITNIITGILPISGPIIYGINLPLVWPFIAGCVGAGIGGLFSGLVGAKKYIYGGFGIFGINTYWNGSSWSLISFVISCLISIFSSTLICLLIYKYRPSEKSQIKKTNRLLIKYFNLISPKKATKEEKSTLVNISRINLATKRKIKEIEKLYAKYNLIDKKIEKLNRNKIGSDITKKKVILLETQKCELWKILNSKEGNLREKQNELLNNLLKMTKYLSLYFKDDNFLLFKNNYFNAIYSLQITFFQLSSKENTFDYKEIKRKH